jgi:alpha-glucosidase
MAVSLLVLLGGGRAGGATIVTQVASPDASVQAKVILDEGRLHYAVSFKGQPVLEIAPLSFSVDGVTLTAGVTSGDIKPYQVKETYPWRGVHSQAINDCNGTTLALSHAASKSHYSLDIRAFNNGIAFRIVVPGSESARVPDEATRFVLPAGSTAWFHDLKGHYEGVHAKKAVEDIKEGEWAAAPLTFKLPRGAGYAAITEAALVNYSGMALQADGRRGFRLVLAHNHPVSYPFRLRYSAADIERLSRPAAVSGTITTPWRVVLIGADLNTLVNADVIHNLCPPPDPRLFPQGLHTDWIKPGRAVWRYLDGSKKNTFEDMTFEEMKEFCRLAGELGFEYNVLEGFWARWTDAQVKEMVAYGKERGVALIVWKHSKSLRDPAARKAFFQRCQDLGIAGAKIDFFDHDAKEVIDFYQTLLREAAEHRLVLNFHGSTKPTGEPRTWPNELVRESIRGMEASKLPARARHDATLPFTRFLAGHGDYTPVHFGARRGDTTWAHQVATAAVFTAPLLLYAAHPKTMLDNPSAPLIKSIPSVWDETVVLPPSEIGEVAVFARRKADTWFLAVVNGPEVRTLKVPLSFLGPGAYHGLMIRDQASDPAAVSIEQTESRRSDAVAIALSAGGGFIARFTRQ